MPLDTTSRMLAPFLDRLTDEELETYGWQLPVAGFGEAGQRRLKGATVMVSRIGGLGGVVAQQLAAAGIGRLVLAHGGNLRVQRGVVRQQVADGANVRHGGPF